uniref:Uncharacterized protein n=1 Tax=Rousettus aegyptiacus TaxID=9407 RepID=A0A7J8FIG6_ROUAE|nr:hypothetical protein HJG63_011842 [Rousettus aegyptiacus]
MAVAASSTGGLRLPDPALSSTNPGNAHLHRVEMTCPPSWSPPPGAQPPAPRAFPWVPLRVSRVRWGHRTGCTRSALAATPRWGVRLHRSEDSTRRGPPTERSHFSSSPPQARAPFSPLPAETRSGPTGL